MIKDYVPSEIDISDPYIDRRFLIGLIHTLEPTHL